MGPQVLGQALVGRVRPGREDQVGQLVLQAAAGHGQSVPADLSRRMTVTEVEPGQESTSKTPVTPAADLQKVNMAPRSRQGVGRVRILRRRPPPVTRRR